MNVNIWQSNGLTGDSKLVWFTKQNIALAFKTHQMFDGFCLVERLFFFRSEIVHLHANVTITDEVLLILTYTRRLQQWSSEGSLTHQTSAVLRPSVRLSVCPPIHLSLIFSQFYLLLHWNLTQRIVGIQDFSNKGLHSFRRRDNSKLAKNNWRDSWVKGNKGFKIRFLTNEGSYLLARKDNNK